MRALLLAAAAAPMRGLSVSDTPQRGLSVFDFGEQSASLTKANAVSTPSHNVSSRSKSDCGPHRNCDLHGDSRKYMKATWGVSKGKTISTDIYCRQDDCTFQPYCWPNGVCIYGGGDPMVTPHCGFHGDGGYEESPASNNDCGSCSQYYNVCYGYGAKICCRWGVEPDANWVVPHEAV